MARLKPGTVLGNGAVVLNANPVHGDPGMNFVLARWEHGASTEFVTWAVRVDDLSAYWGHYHQCDIMAATREYCERTGM